MSDQDWTTVTFTKTQKQKTKEAFSNQHSLAAAKASGSVTTERKVGAASNKSAHTPSSAGMRKLEEDTEPHRVQTVNKNLAQAIMQARLAKKMTQAELATAINERAQVIQQYESGAAMPNGAIIAKLDRALGIRLPRK